VFSPGLAGLVLGEFRRLAVSADPNTPRLTDREAEILRMVGTGLSYKQIAERLVLAARPTREPGQRQERAAACVTVHCQWRLLW
jgi:FixJ family two-component response regulator